MMSIEKFIALYFPLKTRNICTVKTAKWSCFCSAVMFAGFNSQFFFVVKAHKGNLFRVNCDWTNEAYALIYYRIDAILYSFGPFAIMGLTNIAIIYKFVRAKMAARGGTESTNQALVKSATRGTAILITVSLTFILLTGPINIYFSTTTYQHPLIDINLRWPADLNHGINGLLYCVVGSRFRKELTNFLCCRKKEFWDRRSKNIKNTGSTQITAVSSETKQIDLV